MFNSLTRDKWQISQRVLQRKRGGVSVLKAFPQKKKNVTIQIEITAKRIIDFLLDSLHAKL